MKKSVKLAAALLALLMLMGNAFAVRDGYLSESTYSWPVDVPTMKAIEGEDTFDLRIDQKSVTDDYFPLSFVESNGDLLRLLVHNYGADKAIASFTVFLVGVDDNGISAKLTSEPRIGIESVTVGENRYREIMMLHYDNLSIAPGAGYDTNIRCNHDNFTGVRALVGKVTYSDGSSAINPILDDWYEQAMGCPTHVLD